ncbi:MAG: T9SS type A sorting domain-containing protein [Bacteroidales bacterium]|jgi:hypothetical protein|nr:T9SS type A sorting domain-containing protein [Bacteroidales bacterium]
MKAKRILFLACCLVWGWNVYSQSDAETSIINAQNSYALNQENITKRVHLSDASELIGYNIYRNGETINESPITETNYVDTSVEQGMYLYQVTALYTEGESDGTNIVEVIIDTLAKARQYVLVEKGTGTWCPYCPGAALGIDDLLANGKKVLPVAYHSGDSYENSDALSRLTMYGVGSFPTVIFDGVSRMEGGSPNQSLYSYYLPLYEEHIAIPTSIDFVVTGTHTGNAYSLNITAQSNFLTDNSNLVLHAAVVEDHIPEAWQGLTEVNGVCRKMIPDSQGSPISFSEDSIQQVSLNFDWENTWVKDNSMVVIFIQNTETNEVINTTKIDINEILDSKFSTEIKGRTGLYAPSNLVAEHDITSPIVTLSWTAPSTAGEGWIQWDDGQNASAVGSDQSPLQFDVAAKWDSEDLAPLKEMMITKVAFFPTSSSCNYSIRIWNNMNESPILDDEVSVVVGEWNEFILSDSIYLETFNELWVGYHNINTQADYSAGIDNGPAVTGKGDFVRLYEGGSPGSWDNISALGIDNNWNIKFYIEPKTTVGVNDIVSLSANIYPNPAKESLNISSKSIIETVTIYNINGQKLLEEPVFNYTHRINTAGFEAGVYLIQIESKGERITRKIIVQ